MTTRARRGVLLALIGLGLALRLPGLAGDLWLDEIWSLKNALRQASWWDVVAALKTDNNHHLTSLWLRWLGPLAPATWYRLPSLLAGIATIPVAMKLARRDGELSAVVAGGLFAVSYPFVYYSSEARGYAPVVFFSLCAWYCLREYVDRRGWRPLAGFWIASALGVLSHATFVQTFLAALVWCDTHTQRQSRSLRSATAATATAFAVPGLFIAGFYWIALRGLSIAGGPPSSFATAVETLSLLVGGPVRGSLAWGVAGVTAALASLSILQMARRSDDRWIMYLLAGAALPVLFRVVHPEGPLYPRYLLVPGAFLLLAVADLLTRGLRQGPAARIASGLVLALASIGSVIHVTDLARFGRGQFERAVERMVPAGGEATVTTRADFSGHDERVRMLIEHYSARGDRSGLHYVNAGESTAGADWMIVEELQGPDAPSGTVTDSSGRTYRLDGEYRSSALTGVAWLLYRR